jgi:hypothetical protein
MAGSVKKKKPAKASTSVKKTKSKKKPVQGHDAELALPDISSATPPPTLPLGPVLKVARVRVGKWPDNAPDGMWNAFLPFQRDLPGAALDDVFVRQRQIRTYCAVHATDEQVKEYLAFCYEAEGGTIPVPRKRAPALPLAVEAKPEDDDAEPVKAAAEAGKKAPGKKKKSVKAADSSIKKTKSKASVKTKKKGKGK